MKKNIKIELKSKTIDELIKDVRDARSEVAKTVIEMKTGKITNVNYMKNKKKDIARILTFLSQKKDQLVVSSNKVEAKKEEVKASL